MRPLLAAACMLILVALSSCKERPRADVSQNASLVRDAVQSRMQKVSAPAKRAARAFTCADIDSFNQIVKTALDTLDVSKKSAFIFGSTLTLSASGSSFRRTANDAGNMYMLFLKADDVEHIGRSACDPQKMYIHGGGGYVFCFPNDDATRARLTTIDWSSKVTVSGTVQELWYTENEPLSAFISMFAVTGDLASVANTR